jgi:hypothetical protein
MFKLRIGLRSSVELREDLVLIPMQTIKIKMTMMRTPVAVMKEIKTGGDTHDSVL